jgi:hypothetical protein
MGGDDRVYQQLSPENVSAVQKKESRPDIGRLF